MKDKRGKWHSVNTGIQLDRIMSRNGKTVWPLNVSDLKKKMDLAKIIDAFGFAQTNSQRSTTLSEVPGAFKISSENKRKTSTLKLNEFGVENLISVLGDMKVRYVKCRRNGKIRIYLKIY